MNLPWEPRARNGIAAIARTGLIAACAALLATAAAAQGRGYMRVATSQGQIAGESSDRGHSGWILFRSSAMPSAGEIAAMNQSADASGPNPKAAGNPHAQLSKVVNRPVVIVKEKDRSSAALMIAQTSHQILPEVDIVVTNANNDTTVTYRLTDASIISIRNGDGVNGSVGPIELLRFNYAKIEIVR